jgi:hypothetical protein
MKACLICDSPLQKIAGNQYKPCQRCNPPNKNETYCPKIKAGEKCDQSCETCKFATSAFVVWV